MTGLVYADALEVMTLVAALHPRTAPRVDDQRAVEATATIWARMFNRHALTLNQLLEGVERRAESESLAPEVGEIITAARRIRAAASDSANAHPEVRARREGAIDARIAAALGPLVAKVAIDGGGARALPGRPGRTPARLSALNPQRMAEARAEMDAIREKSS